MAEDASPGGRSAGTNSPRPVTLTPGNLHLEQTGSSFPASVTPSGAGFSQRILRRRGVRYLLEQYRRHDWLDFQTLALLVDLDPSATLRVLRQTRPWGVRADEDETHVARLDLLARAHEALGGPRGRSGCGSVNRRLGACFPLSPSSQSLISQ